MMYHIPYRKSNQPKHTFSHLEKVHTKYSQLYDVSVCLSVCLSVPPSTTLASLSPAEDRHLPRARLPSLLSVPRAAARQALPGPPCPAHQGRAGVPRALRVHAPHHLQVASTGGPAPTHIASFLCRHCRIHSYSRSLIHSDTFIHAHCVHVGGFEGGFVFKT